jgi:hypothetical protein
MPLAAYDSVDQMSAHRAEDHTAVTEAPGEVVRQVALAVLYGLAIILLYFLSAGSDAVFVYQGF